MENNNKFDSKSLIAMGLIGIIVMVYLTFFLPKEKPQTPKAQTETAQKSVQHTALDSIKSNPAMVSDTTKVAQDITLKNKELTLVFSAKGGQPKSVLLTQHMAYDVSEANRGHKKPLYLLDGKNSDLNVQFTENGKVLNSRELVFTPIQTANQVTYTTVTPAGGTLSFIYTLKENYLVGFDIQSQGVLVTNKPVLSFNLKALSHEKGRKYEDTKTDFHYMIDELDKTKYTTDTESLQNVDWIAYKGQFFTVVLDNLKGFESSNLKVTKIEDEKSPYLKEFDAKSTLKTNALQANMQWYFGPNDKDLMLLHKRQYQKIVPFGWTIFGYINDFFFAPLFKFLNSLGFLSGGMIILIMTILVKLVTSPIMYKQYRQSAMMRVLKPEIDALNEKNKNADPLKKQQDTMDLYRKVGVSPMAGCIPALLQMPIFMSLLNLFPNLIQLRGKSFLWADDLSAYDSVYSWATQIPFISSFYGNHISLFTVLYAGTMFLLTKIQGVTAQAPTQEGMPDMRFMTYMMPFFLLFFANGLASALSWYYVVSNVITIALVLIIKNYFIDEDKIHAQLQENKKKPEKKKSKFSKLLEEAQRQQVLKGQK